MFFSCYFMYFFDNMEKNWQMLFMCEVQKHEGAAVDLFAFPFLLNFCISIWLHVLPYCLLIPGNCCPESLLAPGLPSIVTVSLSQGCSALMWAAQHCHVSKLQALHLILFFCHTEKTVLICLFAPQMGGGLSLAAPGCVHHCLLKCVWALPHENWFCIFFENKADN